MMNFDDIKFTDEQIAYVQKGISHYNSMFQTLGLGEKRITIELLNIIDNINAKNIPKQGMPVSCKKGCSFCCHIQVAATENEARLITDHCEENNIPITEEMILRLKEQAVFEITDPKGYMFSKHKRCVFLTEEGLCGVYEVRPAACRNYFVFSPPENCDTDQDKYKVTGGKTLTNYDLSTVIPIMVLIQRSHFSTLSRNLLNVIENGNSKMSS